MKTCILILVVIFALATSLIGGRAITKSALTDGEQLWEKAVEAKGGRNKLYAVTSFAVITERPKGKTKSTDLWNLPDKFWRWGNLRPSVLGLSIQVANLSTRKFYWTLDYKPQEPKIETLKSGSRLAELEDAQLEFLLETRWYKPKVLRASKESIGLKMYDVVHFETVGKMPVSLFLDQKTHLPARIAYRSRKTGDVFTWLDLADYRSINGVLVPHKDREDGKGRWATYTVELNPQFDIEVFDRPGKIENGPEQWRINKALPK